ncbi:uncharacterized protein LOC136026837 [Artemia franciscana]|uniref:uncharacterized protein LOC136026837 n=1 Tax=Artemia franciscana TaxID=6661 RepID=UPI0032DB3322
MGKKTRKRGSRGKKFINKYKEIQEKIKVQRSNQEYSREYEYEMVSTICKSTEEGGQQGDEINEDGFQTHFEAKVLEKIDIEGNFENDKLGMKFKECMEIKECKDMEKVDLQESMLEYFELEEENEFQVNDVYYENDDKMTPQQRSNVNKTVYTANELCKDNDLDSYEAQIYNTQSEKNKSALNKSFLNASFLSKKEEDFQKDRPSVIQVNHGASLRNPVDPYLNETKKYSSLSKKVQNFQKDRPSVIQETRGASLCNPGDLHVY